MKKDPRQYLLRIRDAIDRIERYTADGKAAFFTDTKTQDAVIFRLAVIGDAAVRLPGPLRKLRYGLPWETVDSLRNLLRTHHAVEVNAIWRIREYVLPKLKPAIFDAIREIGEDTV